MTTNHPFDRQLAEMLVETSERRVPDHLTEVLNRTSRTRQRAWWSSPERWLPMQATARFAPALPRINRALIVAVLLLIALVAAAVFGGVGRPRLPAPFGPAANGDILIGVGGDIARLDPATGQRTTLIAGPQWDFGGTFSRDGTKFAFGRFPTDPSAAPSDVDLGMIVAVANADGSNVRELTPYLKGNCSSDWSPDGRQFVFRGNGPDERGILEVLDLERGTVRTIDPRISVRCSWLAYRPTAGREILFRGDDGLKHGVFTIRPDGTGLRQINTERPVCDCDTGGVSPDGHLVAVDRWGADGVVRIWLLDVDAGTERELPMPPGTFSRGGIFSPDGSQIAFPRLRRVGANQNAYQVVVAPVDGSDFGLALGAEMPLPSNGSDEAFVSLSFAPDGKSIIAVFPDDPSSGRDAIWRLPIDGSPGTFVDQGAFVSLDIQRRAP
jgi:dipeptidyl aminopeptidase/acylaminoacyl peptidase